MDKKEQDINKNGYRGIGIIKDRVRFNQLIHQNERRAKDAKELS